MYRRACGAPSRNTTNVSPPARAGSRIHGVARLTLTLDRSGWETGLDDAGDLQVGAGVDVPFLIKIDSNAKNLMLHISWSYRSDSSCQIVNEGNKWYPYIKFSSSGKSIDAWYFMTYEYGLDLRQLVSMGEKFSSDCRTFWNELNGVKDDDDDDDGGDDGDVDDGLWGDDDDGVEDVDDDGENQRTIVA